MKIDNITSVNNILINGKIVDVSYPVIKIFPKHNQYGFISEDFVLN